MHSTRITCSLRFMKNTIGHRIAEARIAAALNQSQLAAKLDVSPQSVQQWEGDKTTPRRNRIKALAMLLSVSPEWILFGENASTAHHDNSTDKVAEVIAAYQVTDVVTSGKISDIVSVPVLDTATAVNKGAQIDMDAVGSHVILGKELLDQYNLTEENSVALKASTNEMAPRIQHGDTVLIDLSDTQPRDGGIYAITVSWEIKLKRLIAQIDGRWIITCDNTNIPGFREETLTHDDLTKLNILGRVVMVMGGV